MNKRIVAGFLLALSITLTSCGTGGSQNGVKDNGNMGHPDKSGSHMSGMSEHEMVSASRKMVMPNGSYSDKAFIDAMVPHHEGAVEMAEVALEKADHEEIKTLAKNIISAQKSEIKKFGEIRKQRFGSAKPHMSMSGMDMQTMGVSDTKKLSKARPFDKAFIDAMIPHHESAIAMAKVVRHKTKDPEIQRIADDIVSAQMREIDRMSQWRKEWYPGG